VSNHTSARRQQPAKHASLSADAFAITQAMAMDSGISASMSEGNVYTLHTDAMPNLITDDLFAELQLESDLIEVRDHTQPYGSLMARR